MADINLIFESLALKIAPANKPFWYTSGLIGPYFINTQFVCGGEAKANEILKFIDDNSKNPTEFFSAILGKLEEVYESNEIYKTVIDEISEQVAKAVKEQNITYISGGERRDWFFSPIVAKKLNLPCLYIYNDLKVYKEDGQQINDLEGAKVINVADLLTAGSSCVKKWLPAIQQINGQLTASANIVDRCQGGEDNLEAVGIKHNICLFKIDQSFFDMALNKELINQEQYQILSNYLKDQHQSMREWLVNNPEYVKESMSSDNEKTAKRAKLLNSENFYEL